MDLLKYVGSIILWMVALMSGILSLLRELFAIYRGQEIHPRSLFWNCVIVAFILSAVALWFIEHQRYLNIQRELAAERDRKQPKLTGEIGFVITSQGKEANTSMVTLFATIKNNGAPSVADNFESRVRLASGQELTINRISFLPKGPFKFSGAEGEPELEVAVCEELGHKAIAQPIPTGGAINGFLMGLVKGANVNEIVGDKITYFVSFKDSIGKKYEIFSSGKKSPNFILPEQLGARDGRNR